jgi:hypothetical protein
MLRISNIDISRPGDPGTKNIIGLGDCLLIAACAQEYYKKFNKKLNYSTNPLLYDILRDNPYFNLNEKYVKPDLVVKWYADINKASLSKLHTIQRFSLQLGFYIDPTAVVDIYLEGKRVLNVPTKKYVCINALANERVRRYIPEKYVNFIAEYAVSKGYEVIWTGDNYTQNTIKDIKTCTALYRDCTLFVGPVSFQYHLAGALRTPSLLFCSYMPYYKFSHFINTDHVYSTRSCVYRCEETCDDNNSLLRHENDCLKQCKAVDYDEAEIAFKLNKFLK